MDPITLSAIMAGGSSIMGMIEGNKAQKQQMEIARKNYELQREAQQRQWQIAQQTMDMQRASTTDAEGNTTEYIPGVGWVSKASGQTKAVMDASRAEQLARLTEDAGMGRQNMRDDFARRGREGGMADTTMNEWKQNEVPDANTIRHALLRQKTAGIDRGFDDESRMAMRQANRSGASNVGEISAALAARRADAHSNARNDSYLEGLSTRDNLLSSRDSRLGNKYNMLAGRSTGQQPGFMPDDTNSSLRSALQARQNTNAQAMGVAGSLAGNAPQMDTNIAKPNYSNALALGGLANLVSTFKSLDDGGGGFKSGTANANAMKAAGTSIRNQSKASPF